jgi:hypothetical protein
MKMAGRKKVALAVKTKTPAGPLTALVEDAVCLCEDAVIREVNPAGLTLLGFHGKRTPVGQLLADFVYSDDKKKLSKSLAYLTRSKTAKRLEIVGVDGRVWVADVLATKVNGAKSKDYVLVSMHSADPDAAVVGPKPISISCLSISTASRL